MTTTGQGASPRVVIAEDESIIRLDLRELLEEEGYSVVGETGRPRIARVHLKVFVASPDE